ncbi:glyoxylate reductase/hydroxypyruvate reductase-like [Babylonia areolata]|uniref:glyoxylate reductase/hydroxypyruvate reductase-like n=1 Tax=Babylonia areolata TaxID=304850 RepID=UPI003FD22655
MAGRPFVYVSRGIPQEVLQRLAAECEVQSFPEQRFITREELKQNARGAHALIVHPPDRVDAEVLDAVGPQLRVVGTMSVGLDHVDVAECRRRGVEVGYTPGVLTTATAELTIGLLMATARRMKEAMRAVHNGIWGTRWDDALWMTGAEVSGSVVGIVGLGRIGLAVAKRLRAFEPAKILYCGHSPKPTAQEVGAEYVSFEELLKSSDMVIATCSVSPQNRHLFNHQAFSVMKPSAIFINVTRGALVDQEALLEALRSGQLGAAGLDVSTPEPLPPDHPLLQLPTLTLLPHLGSASRRTRCTMATLTVTNVLAGLQGRPLPSPVP